MALLVLGCLITVVIAQIAGYLGDLMGSPTADLVLVSLLGSVLVIFLLWIATQVSISTH